MTWPHCFQEDEVSALQHAYNILIDDGEEVFASECQNSPLRPQDNSNLPTAEDIAARTNKVHWGVVPNERDVLTAFIDVSEKVLWWMVCGWSEGFGGSIVKYGVWPGQRTNYVTLASVRRTLKSMKPSAGFEAALEHALEELCSEILGREWVNEGGTVYRVSRCLVDANWSREVVERFCRRSLFASTLTPSHGRGVKASMRALNDVKTGPRNGEKRGLHWRLDRSKHAGLRKVTFDTNYWKAFVFRRLSAVVGNTDSVDLCEAEHSHKMLVDQLLAETCQRIVSETTGRTVDEFEEIKKGADNHFLDCFVGCAVGASMENVELRSAALLQNKPKRRMTLQEMAQS